MLGVSLSASKKHHWQSRHPDLDLALIQAEAPLEVDASPLLPEEQRAWSCPVKGCHAGLPALASQAMKRAKRKHASAHGLTLQQMFYMSVKGKPKGGAAKANVAKHEQVRASKFGTHDIVQVVPQERIDNGQRGNAYYCRVCFSKLGKTTQPHELLPCAERIQRLQTNGWTMSKKRSWWKHLQKAEPVHAANFLAAVGRTKEYIDEFFKTDVETESSKRWKEVQKTKKKRMLPKAGTPWCAVPRSLAKASRVKAKAKARAKVAPRRGPSKTPSAKAASRRGKPLARLRPALGGFVGMLLRGLGKQDILDHLKL